MNVIEAASDLQREYQLRKYFVDLEILEQTRSVIKARLTISAGLFVQVYRNDPYQTTSLTLIHNESRLFARDEVDGLWHRHLYSAPDEHDFSAEGQKAVSLADFLNEVEKLLAELDLP